MVTLPSLTMIISREILHFFIALKLPFGKKKNRFNFLTLLPWKNTIGNHRYISESTESFVVSNYSYRLFLRLLFIIQNNRNIIIFYKHIFSTIIAILDRYNIRGFWLVHNCFQSSQINVSNFRASNCQIFRMEIRMSNERAKSVFDKPLIQI